MRRVQMCKKVNTNDSFNHLNRKLTHFNTLSPEILVGQIWLQDEATAVEIIELNTSDEFDLSTDEVVDSRLNHSWALTNSEKLQKIEDSYKVNKAARERRRLNNETHFRTTNTATNTNNHTINSNVYSDILENQYIEDCRLLNHKVNCFTMINENYINSDTSSDADIVTSDDFRMEHNDDEEEIVTYDPELDQERRTIWIYSFKNKQLLSEDDYDTAAKDLSFCSTSSSTERDEEIIRDKSNTRRLGSPIPSTYIPRLNLTLGPTLSTVSEVTETNRQTSPDPSYKSPRTRFQKQRNSWIMSESEKLGTPTSGKLQKSTNIVSWMALSPREKRRRSKEQGDKWVGNLLKLETPIEDNNQKTPDRPVEENFLRLQVDVDVHVNVNEKTPEKRSLGTPNSAYIELKSNLDKISQRSKYAPDIKDDAFDRGDHMKFEQKQLVPSFSGPSHSYETMKYSDNLRNKIGNFTVIEDSCSKSNPEAWEREEKIEIETASYDYVTDKLECAQVNADTVWIKNNAPFLTPSAWDDYAKVAEPPLSIELSISNVATTREPWYKRFFKKINCFK